MGREILAAAIEQAERAQPAVRAAAYLHAARVLTRYDLPSAEALLDRGIALARELSESERTPILTNAIFLAAAVAPSRALPLYAAYRRQDPFGNAVVGLVNAMADHGHIADALAYLRDPLPGDRFPLHFVGNLARACPDEATRGLLLRAAIQAWREQPDSEAAFGRLADRAFAGFFSHSWHLVPREEALQLAKEIADRASQEPNNTDSAGLPLLDLEAAIRSSTAPPAFPSSRGKLSADEDAMMIGCCFGTDDDPPNQQVIYMNEALANDFQAAFAEAYSRFARDTEANLAPKECWPSTYEFRNILFKAGEHLDMAATKYLECIPDPDLRLFAQIELCAALAGLPQFGGTVIYPARASGPAIRSGEVGAPETSDPAIGDAGFGGPFVRCPKCRWAPGAEHLWMCHCGHRWNTFDTGGICPGCQYQWRETMCPKCGKWSAHSDWYAHKS
jgi:hypothetical protein